jgi:adenosine deaminase
VTLNGRPLDVRTAVKTVAAARESGTAELALGSTAQWVVDRRIPLEVCVSSNSKGIVDGVDNHPIDLLRELGFTITVNPDNRLLSKTSISQDFRRIEHQFGWDVEEFTTAELAGVEATFLSKAERDVLRADLLAGIAAFTD